jgi:hypothetical protein
VIQSNQTPGFAPEGKKTMMVFNVFFLCAVIVPLLEGAIVDKLVKPNEEAEVDDGTNNVVAAAAYEKTEECEFFDQACAARARDAGEDISACFGPKKCSDDVTGAADGEAGATAAEEGAAEAFCFTVWQNGTGSGQAGWNIKRQGCLRNHGSSQVRHLPVTVPVPTYRTLVSVPVLLKLTNDFISGTTNT